YKGVTRQGVLAGMVAGFLTSALWLSDLQPGEGVFVLKDLTYNLFEAVPGFLAGFAATFLVSRLTRKSSA
ncbi:MAG: sodium:proline symporter, partial [Pseudomonadota bacterium]